MKCWLILIAISSYTHLYSQGSLRAIIVDENLTVSFPYSFTSITKGHFKTYTSTGVNIHFVLQKEFSYPGDESKEQFKNSMQTFLELMDSIEYLKVYKKHSVDTIIGTAYGRLVSVEGSSDLIPLKKMYVFYTTMDTFSYAFYAKLIDDDTATFEHSVKKFFNDIHFAKDYYSALPEKISEVKRRKIFKRIIGLVLGSIVLGWLIYYQRSKKITI